MVKACHGVPIALKVTGGALPDKHPDFWEVWLPFRDFWKSSGSRAKAARLCAMLCVVHVSSTDFRVLAGLFVYQSC